MKPDAIIIGGGISGLATAFYLQRRGLSSTIVEASGRLGGLIGTERFLGCELEAGPDSFLATKPALLRLATELGISGQLIGSNDSARRVFIVREDRLLPLPEGMVMMVPSQWKPVWQSELFSLSTKTRFLKEYFAKPRSRNGDFSIRDLMEDHFGLEALQYVTEPLLAGVYGGDAGSLSARSVLPRFVEYEEKFGSLIRGVQAAKKGTVPAEVRAKPGLGVGTVPDSGTSVFLSFAGGMQTVVDSLSSAVQGDSQVLYCQADGIRQSETGWEVSMGNQTVGARHLVLACPAHQSARLLRQVDPTLEGLLSEIPYSSSLLVTLIFERLDIQHPLNGFGFLVPPPERHLIAAMTWVNTKFPSRVAPGLAVLRAFLVDPQAESFGQKSDDCLVEAVLLDLRRFMNFGSQPRAFRIQRWPKSMPQYVVGHEVRIGKIREALGRQPGLHLVSNYLDGVGIPDCVRNAETTSLQIA